MSSVSIARASEAAGSPGTQGGETCHPRAAEGRREPQLGGDPGHASSSKKAKSAPHGAAGGDPLRDRIAHGTLWNGTPSRSAILDGGRRSDRISVAVGTGTPFVNNEQTVTYAQSNTTTAKNRDSSRLLWRLDI